MSGIRESVEVTSSREYVVLASSNKTKEFTKKVKVKSYTEKRLLHGEPASFQKVPDNACVPLFTSSPESVAFIFQHAH